MKIISIYVTFPDKQEAQKITDFLIAQKLIACGNIFPISSSYFWDGQVQNEDEWVCIMKSKKSLWNTLKKTIEKKHSYEVPCIIAYDIKTNESYAQWVCESTK